MAKCHTLKYQFNHLMAVWHTLFSFTCSIFLFSLCSFDFHCCHFMFTFIFYFPQSLLSFQITVTRNWSTKCMNVNINMNYLIMCFRRSFWSKNYLICSLTSDRLFRMSLHWQSTISLVPTTSVTCVSYISWSQKVQPWCLLAASHRDGWPHKV